MLTKKIVQEVQTWGGWGTSPPTERVDPKLSQVDDSPLVKRKLTTLRIEINHFFQVNYNRETREVL